MNNKFQISIDEVIKKDNNIREKSEEISRSFDELYELLNTFVTNKIIEGDQTKPIISLAEDLSNSSKDYKNEIIKYGDFLKQTINKFKALDNEGAQELNKSLDSLNGVSTTTNKQVITSSLKEKDNNLTNDLAFLGLKPYSNDFSLKDNGSAIIELLTF